MQCRWLAVARREAMNLARSSTNQNHRELRVDHLMLDINSPSFRPFRTPRPPSCSTLGDLGPTPPFLLFVPRSTSVSLSASSTSILSPPAHASACLHHISPISTPEGLRSPCDNAPTHLIRRQPPGVRRQALQWRPISFFHLPLRDPIFFRWRRPHPPSRYLILMRSPFNPLRSKPGRCTPLLASTPLPCLPPSVHPPLPHPPPPALLLLCIFQPIFVRLRAARLPHGRRLRLIAAADIFSWRRWLSLPILLILSA